MTTITDVLRLPDDVSKLVDPALVYRPRDLTIACYTFPHYHRSAYNDRVFAPGWTEYALMRGCRPHFPGHHQPRTPLLGELDERDPATWETYIPLAAGAGIDVFLWDWYWYDGGPVLHEALEQGFLQARASAQMRFAIMWTNHHWSRWFPTAGLDQSAAYPDVVEPGGVGAFERLSPGPECTEDVWRSISYIVARYFHDPRYWRIQGQPVLSVWDAALLRQTFGVEGTRALLDELRTFARKLGHPGIHLHASQGGLGAVADFDAMGFDSYALYTSIVAGADRRPDDDVLPDYGVVAADVVRTLWPELDARSPLPCFPCISPGWDDSPRHMMRTRGDSASRKEWPGHTVVVNETPSAFEAFARAALAYLNARPAIPAVMTIGCWNEWTEGHYLLPDTRLGYGMLRALARALK
jgi:hypothetical protein